MKTRVLFLSLILLVPMTVCLGQAAPKVDAVAYFDEKKRWYNEFTEHWFYFFDIPEQEIRESIVHWEKIGDKTSDLENQLTGTYGSGGDTHEEYLRFSPNDGFVWLHVNKCNGGPMRVIRGSVETTKVGVTLIPDVVLGKTEGHGQHTSESKRIELIAIKWYGSPFLIQKGEIASFADFVAGLGEFDAYPDYVLGNPFLIKMGSETPEENRKFELPVFPADYAKFLKKPIRGKILRIGKSNRRVDEDSDTYDKLATALQVELDANDKALTNLQLFAPDTEQDITETFTVKTIVKNVATVEHVRIVSKKNCKVTPGQDCKDFDHIKLRKGMVLSSNGY